MATNNTISTAVPPRLPKLAIKEFRNRGSLLNYTALVKLSDVNTPYQSRAQMPHRNFCFIVFG